MWRAYPAPYKYFSSEAKHSGMAARLCNMYFSENLASMIDILQEISLLSNALQARNLTLTKAERLIKRTIKVFEMLKETKEIYEREIDVIAASDSFKDIHLVENNKVVGLPRQKLLETVSENMKKRLMNCEGSQYFFCIVLFIFILHSRESELYRYILDGKSALAWELPFPRCLGHLSST